MCGSGLGGGEKLAARREMRMDRSLLIRILAWIVVYGQSTSGAERETATRGPRLSESGNVGSNVTDVWGKKHSHGESTNNGIPLDSFGA